MPSPTTIEEFLDLVRKSEVVEDKRLSPYLDKLRASQPLPAAPGLLAGLLVRDGMLTHFQAEQFLQGKWRRFSIGKYKVLEKLGAGGMGSVYLCEHKLMRRRVAVKVLPTAKAEDTSSLERFYREARAVAALDHPNIVRAYDIDQDDKLHFLVMEHVDGASFQEIVKKAGAMDVLRACHYIRQAALGLQHAHETASLVHRDIKPGNILVDRNGIVKILDMGLARFFRDEDDVLTKKFEENVLGTADYLAPEQALDSHSVDIRADIYSLGATFYFCLTGRTPFAEGTIAQKLIWHQTRQPKPLRQLRPETPEGVVAIIEKMMAKDAAQRYATPSDVADALAAWTQTPIPPPPDNEMPQLSLAAMGASPSDASMSGAPKTPASNSELSPTPRKVWQVSQNITPSPLSSPPPPTPSVAPPRDLRKTNPPAPGPLAIQPPKPAPSPVAAPAPVARASVAAPAPPQARVAPAPPPQRSAAPVPGAIRPAVVNGAAQTTTAPARPMPTDPQESPSWENLVAENGSASLRSSSSPRPTRRGPVSSTKRLDGLPPIAPTRSLRWVVGIASLIVVALVTIVGILTWMFGKKTDSLQRDAAAPIIYRVNRLGTNGASSSIAAALNKVNAKKGQPARIIVEEDLAEIDVRVIELPHLRIEAAEGKTILWKAPPKALSTSKLLTVNKSEGFRLKGFTFDGENRIDCLINLYHHCPGTVLEDLTLKGFNKYGIWVMNCEGDPNPDRYIVLTRLTFDIPRPQQTAVFFSVHSHTPAIPKNKFVAVRDDCKFVGPGTKIQTPDLATLDHVEFPADAKPVQGK